MRMVNDTLPEGMIGLKARDWSLSASKAWKKCKEVRMWSFASRTTHLKRCQPERKSTKSGPVTPGRCRKNRGQVALADLERLGIRTEPFPILRVTSTDAHQKSKKVRSMRLEADRTRLTTCLDVAKLGPSLATGGQEFATAFSSLPGRLRRCSVGTVKAEGLRCGEVPAHAMGQIRRVLVSGREIWVNAAKSICSSEALHKMGRGIRTDANSSAFYFQHQA